MTHTISLNSTAPSGFAALWQRAMGLAARREDNVTSSSKRFSPVATTGSMRGIAVVHAARVQGGQWRVHFAASDWTARAAEPGVEFALGDVVQVVGRYGTVLLIKPVG